MLVTVVVARFLFILVKELSKYTKNHKANDLLDTLKYLKEELELEDNIENKEHLKKDIEETKEQLENGYLSLRVEWGAEEAVIKLLNIMRTLKLVEYSIEE